MHATRRPVVRRVLVGLLLVGGCATGSEGWDVLMPDAEEGETMRVTGMIRHLEIEGGVYVIRDTAGTSYQPTNLPDDYRTDGLPVEADVIMRKGAASIAMVGPIVQIARIRRSGAVSVSGDTAGVNAPPGVEGADVPTALAGTAWRLTGLGGRAALESVEVTLVFHADGTVAGLSSCNRFSGPVEVSGDSIAFGPLVATRMPCAGPANDQESRFFAALADAYHWRLEDGHLLIHGRADRPLRFAPLDEDSPDPAGKSE